MRGIQCGLHRHNHQQEMASVQEDETSSYETIFTAKTGERKALMNREICLVSVRFSESYSTIELSANLLALCVPMVATSFSIHQ